MNCSKKGKSYEIPNPLVASDRLTSTDSLLKQFKENFSSSSPEIGSKTECSNRKENQDACFSLVLSPGIVCAAVFDGHGKQGKLAAELSAKIMLAKIKITITKDFMEKMLILISKELTDLFAQVQKELRDVEIDGKIINLKWSGCTATVVFLHKFRGIIANVGDSECMIFSKTDDKVTHKVLTKQHRADVHDEKKRVESSQGKVINGRIYYKDIKMPGLMISRTMGDFGAHIDLGVSCEPFVNEFKLNRKDLAMVLASDGLWDFVSLTEAGSILKTCRSPQEASEKLVKLSIANQDCVKCDNTTAVVIFLEDELMRKARFALFSPRQSATLIFPSDETHTTRKSDKKEEDTEEVVQAEETGVKFCSLS